MCPLPPVTCGQSGEESQKYHSERSCMLHFALPSACCSTELGALGNGDKRDATSQEVTVQESQGYGTGYGNNTPNLC